MGSPISSRGPLAKLFDSTLTAAAASFDVTSIDPAYFVLWFCLVGRGSQAATAVEVQLRFNNDSGANYDDIDLNGNAAGGGTAAAAAQFAQTAGTLGFVPGSTGVADRAGQIVGEVVGYSGTVFQKVCESRMGLTYTNADEQSGVNHVNWRNTAAINRLTILPTAGNFIIGTRLALYGLG